MSWSLFQLLSCIPISQVITARYVSSSHSLLISNGGFDAGLSVIWSSNLPAPHLSSRETITPLPTFLILVSTPATGRHSMLQEWLEI